MRKLRSIAAAFTAMAAFAFPAAVPAEEVLEGKGPTEMLIEDIEQIPLGRDLTRIMGETGFRMKLVSAESLAKFNPCSNASVVGLTYGRNLVINVTLPDAELVDTAAHEGRHMWQRQDGAVKELELDPKRSFILNRFKEADAYAFGIHFTYEYEKATGRTLVPVTDDPWQFHKLHPYKEAYAWYKFDRDIGISPLTAYKSLMKRAFALTRFYGYEEAFFADTTSPALRREVPDAEFIKTLRRLGTIGFDGKQGNVFASWTDAELTDLEKIGGIAPKSKQLLDDMQKGIMPPKKAGKVTCGNS